MRDLLIELVAGAVVVSLIFGAGWWARGSRDAGRENTYLQDLIDDYREQAARLRTVADQAEASRIKHVEWRAAQRERLEAWLALPADGCELDPAGIELWNAANAGAAAGAAATGMVGAMQAPAPVAGRHEAITGGEPREGDGRTGRLRPAPRESGGVGARGE